MQFHEKNCFIWLHDFFFAWTFLNSLAYCVNADSWRLKKIGSCANCRPQITNYNYIPFWTSSNFRFNSVLVRSKSPIWYILLIRDCEAYFRFSNFRRLFLICLRLFMGTPCKTSLNCIFDMSTSWASAIFKFSDGDEKCDDRKWLVSWVEIEAALPLAVLGIEFLWEEVLMVESWGSSNLNLELLAGGRKFSTMVLLLLEAGWTKHDTRGIWDYIHFQKLLNLF